MKKKPSGIQILNGMGQLEILLWIKASNSKHGRLKFSECTLSQKYVILKIKKGKKL